MNPLAILFLAALAMIAIGAATFESDSDPLASCLKTHSIEVCQHEVYGG